MASLIVGDGMRSCNLEAFYLCSVQLAVVTSNGKRAFRRRRKGFLYYPNFNEPIRKHELKP